MRDKVADEFGAYLGLGNIHYLKRPLEINPDSDGTWFNYAIVLIQTGQMKKARLAAAKAISLAGGTLKNVYQKQSDSAFPK